MTEVEFKTLFDKYHKDLVFFAKRIIGDFFCEDIVEDVFLKLWNIRDRAYEIRNMKSFLYQCVQSSCLETFRVKSGKYRASYSEIINRIEPSEDYADASIIRSELLRLIVEKIDSLPPKQRKIFDLVFINGFHPREVASILDISQLTVVVVKNKLSKEFRIFGRQIFPKKCYIIDSDKRTISKRYSKKRA